MDNLLNFIGQKISLIRTKKGLSIQELANKSDLTKTYLWQMEKGDVNFSIKKLLSISNALDIDITALFPSNNNILFSLNKINSSDNKELIFKILDYCTEIDNKRDLELINVLLEEMKK